MVGVVKNLTNKSIKHILIISIIVFFINKIYHQKWHYRHILFIILYSFFMNILSLSITFPFINALPTIFLITQYLKHNFHLERISCFFYATLFQYFISFSFDFFPYDLFSIQESYSLFISYISFICLLFLLYKTKIINNHIYNENNQFILIAYMHISLLFIILLI